MAAEVTLTIDDTEVTVPAGSTIFQAAEAAGIDIPHLCYDPKLRLPPSSSCRLCVVEIEGARTLATSCSHPAGEGMVLVFPREGRHSLWMRDTWISLDMIHVSAAGRVVGIVENARPHTDQSRTIDRPSLAVIEVNAGFARRHGITVGNVVRFYEIK